MSEVVTTTMTTDTIVENTSTGSINVRGENSNNTNLQQGLCKAWIMQETGTSILDSFNISTLTDSGTGLYTCTFTNNMSNMTFPVLQQMNPWSYTSSSRTVLNGSRANHSDGQATTHYIQKSGQLCDSSIRSAVDVTSGSGVMGELT